MERKRPLTLSAGIVNIVAFAIYIILTGIAAYVALIALALISDLGASGAETATATATLSGMLIGCGIRFALAIASIVMSAKVIKLSKASVQDYSAAKSKIISVVVINFIIVAFGLLSYLTSGLGASITLLVSFGEILMFVAMLVVAILLLVDIKNNKKLAAEEQAQIIAEASKPVETAPVATAEDDKLDKLAKLNEMKANGLINDQEYEALKADILK